MDVRALLIVILASVAIANELEDGEQKKRATAKGTTINTIPTGVQKQEFNYVYQQSPNPPNVPATYFSQPQIPNTFFPNLQTQPNQYYQQEQPVYSTVPQVNLSPQPNLQQFSPINFIPNPGYQSKYQLIPSKTPNGQIQLTIVPQQSLLTPPPAYPAQQFYSAPPQTQLHPQVNPFSQGLVAQPSLGFQYPQGLLQGQPSQMLLYQPSPPVLNNYLYSNPAQHLLNYFQSNPQAKYQLLYGQQASAAEFDKSIGQVNRPSKEDNEINITNDFLPADSSTNYKDSYAASSSIRGPSYKSS